MKVRLLSAVVIAIALATVAAVGPVHADAGSCSKTWVGGVSSSWWDGGNWSPAGVPGGTDNVCITGDGNYTVEFTSASTVAGVTVGAVGNAQQPTLWIKGTVSAATLTSTNGFTNTGTITLETAGSAGTSNLSATSGTLTNLGTINVNPGTGGGRSINANIDNQGTINFNVGLTFSRSGGTYTNSGDFNLAAGKTLTVSGNGQTFNQSAGSLAILGSFVTTSAGFNYNGGTITGTPDLTSSNLGIGAGATAPATFTMRGASTLAGDVKSGQSVFIYGGLAGGHANLTSATGFTNAGIITLETVTSNYNTTLTVTSGTLTNLGTIDVNEGTGGYSTIAADLDNQGTINANGNLTLSKASGTYSNSGYFNIATAKILTISGNSQVFNQNGELNVLGDVTITSATFNQNGGNLPVVGSFTVSTGNFNYSSGTISGTVDLRSSNLTLGTGTSGPATFIARGGSTLAGDVTSSQTILIYGGSTGFNANLTSATGFTNSGTITLQTVSTTYNTQLTVTSGTLTNLGTINVNESTGGTRTISANIDNQGTINANGYLTLSKSGGIYTNNGTFNVAADKILTINGSSQAFNQNGGTLAILGSFPMTSATFNFNGGSITGTPDLTSSNLNLGTLATGGASFVVKGISTMSGDVKFGQSIVVRGSAAGSTATLTSATSFTNTGTITLDSQNSNYQSNLTVTSGTLTNTGTIDVEPGTGGYRTINANLDNHGTMNFNANLTLQKTGGSYTNSGAINVAAGQTLTVNGSSQEFNQNAGTLTILGAFSVTSATFNFNGGAITGTVALLSSNLNLGVGATASAAFIARGGSNLAGDLKFGQSIAVKGSVAGSNATMTAANGFTNAGTITLESENSTYQSNLAVTSGALTNVGIIDVNPGTGGPRNIYANLDNQGTINANESLTLQKSNGTFSNSGAFNVAAGKTLTINGYSQVFNQNNGALTISGAFSMTSATFNFNGGTITGIAALNSSNLNLGAWATAAANFITRGGSNLTGDVKFGQTVLIRGSSTHATATLTAANGFTNAGTITMETEYSSHASNLTVTSGTLTNTGTIDANPGTGGTRTITGNVDNQGTINAIDQIIVSGNFANYATLNAPGGLDFNKAGGAYTNTATINLPAGATMNISNGTFRQTSGGIAGGGAISVGGYGTFYGVGSVEANVNNLGHFGPGSSPGILNITGNYTQPYYAYLDVEIGGTEPGIGYDQLNVSGTASLAGYLNVTVFGGYLPSACESLQIITWGSRTGTFGTITGLLGAGGSYYLRADYNTGDLTLLSYDNTSKVNVRPVVGLALLEGGPPEQYLVCLKDQPTADVTVTASPDAQLTALPGVLTFSRTDPLNTWNSPRTLTVGAVDDFVTEYSPHTGTITHASASADPSYNGVSVASVTAEITDNDAVPQLAVPGPQSAQYSDALSFGVSATDPDNPASTLRFSATGLPAGLTLTDSLNGTATISGTIGAPSGTYDASISVADPQGHTDVETVAITVAREGGTLNYTGVTRVYAGTPITLTATLAQAADGSLGNLTTAAVIFDITNSSGGTTSYGPLPVSAAGQASYIVPGGQPQGTYTATVRIDPANGYFTASNRGIGLVASDPSSPLWAVQYRAGAPSPGYSYALPFFEFWQQVLIRNRGASAVYDVVANIARVAISTEVVDGQVSVGTIPAGGTAWSSDTFRLQVNLSAPPAKCDSFVWRIQYRDQVGEPPHEFTDIPQYPPGLAPGGCR